MIRWIRGRWRDLLSPGGRGLLIGLCILWSAGLLSLRIPIHHALWAVLYLGAVAFVAALIFRPKVTLNGILPGRIGAGQLASTTFNVSNRSLLPVYDLGLSCPGLSPHLSQENAHTRIPHIPGKGAGSIPLEIRAHKRGLYEIPRLRAWTEFPFGIWRMGARRTPPSQLLVLPHFDRLTSFDVSTGRRYQPGGIALSADLGESPEYIGNRQYRPGDPFKHIDFRSWARLAEPAVKEYQEEYYCRIALVVDTYVPASRRAGREGFEELEAVISLSAAIADVVARGEYIVDLFAAGPDLYVFRAGRSIAHFENILELLACVDACRKSPFETIAPALTQELNNITTVIYVLMDWDRQREAFVRAAAEAGCSTRVLVVKDTETKLPCAEAESWTGPITKLTCAQIKSGSVDSL